MKQFVTTEPTFRKTVGGFLHPEEKERIVNIRAHQGVNSVGGRDKQMRTSKEATIQQTGKDLKE